MIYTSVELILIVFTFGGYATVISLREDNRRAAKILAVLVIISSIIGWQSNVSEIGNFLMNCLGWFQSALHWPENDGAKPKVPVSPPPVAMQPKVPSPTPAPQRASTPKPAPVSADNGHCEKWGGMTYCD
jgi:hypothetical protein